MINALHIFFVGICLFTVALTALVKSLRASDAALWSADTIGTIVYEERLLPILNTYKSLDTTSMNGLMTAASNNPEREFWLKCAQAIVSPAEDDRSRFMLSKEEILWETERGLQNTLQTRTRDAVLRAGLSEVSLEEAAKETKWIVKNMEIEYIRMLRDHSLSYPILHDGYATLLRYRKQMAKKEHMKVVHSRSSQLWSKVFKRHQLKGRDMNVFRNWHFGSCGWFSKIMLWVAAVFIVLVLLAMTSSGTTNQGRRRAVASGRSPEEETTGGRGSALQYQITQPPSAFSPYHRPSSIYPACCELDIGTGSLSPPPPPPYSRC